MAFCLPANLGFPCSASVFPTLRTSFAPSPASKFRASRRRAICAELQTKPQAGPPAALKSEQLIRRYWDLAANGKYSTTIPCFADDVVYHDGMYPKPFMGREALLAHFTSMEEALPPSLRFVVDDVTASADRAGARWHVETPDGTHLPLSRGLSMYNIVEQNGELLIGEAWEYGETSLKVPSLVFPLLRLSAWLLPLVLGGASKPKSDG